MSRCCFGFALHGLRVRLTDLAHPGSAFFTWTVLGGDLQTGCWLEVSEKLPPGIILALLTWLVSALAASISAGRWHEWHPRL